AWAAEYALLQVNVVVNGDVVLDFAMVTNGDLVAHKDVLPKGHSLANFCAAAYMHKVPHAAAFTNLRAFVYDGTFVFVVAHAFTLASSGCGLAGFCVMGAVRIT